MLSVLDGNSRRHPSRHSPLVTQCSLFAWPGDEAQRIKGKLELRAAADEGCAHFFVVAIPIELHGQDIGIGVPLQSEGQQRLRDRTRHQQSARMDGGP